MSHSTKINLIADQEIELLGIKVNVHMIESIAVDSNGNINSFCIKDSRTPIGFVWVARGMDYIPQDIEEYKIESYLHRLG